MNTISILTVNIHCTFLSTLHGLIHFILTTHCLNTIIYRGGNRSKEVMSLKRWETQYFNPSSFASRAHTLNHSAMLPSTLDLAPSSTSGSL